MTITRNGSIQLILLTLPEYRVQWWQYVAEWALDEDRPFGLDVADFSTFACNIINTGDDVALNKIIDLTEEMITNGDREVKDAFKHQFLENITNRMNDISIQRFTSRLRENSKFICIELDTLWGTKMPGLT